MLYVVRQQRSPDSGGELALVAAQARAGNLDAFNTLFETYNSRICTYLARMIGNDEEGRDLAQETFLKAWSMLPAMRDPARFGPWLYRIATNIAIDHLRAQKVRRWFPWTQGDKYEAAEQSLQTRDSTECVAETELVALALASVAPRYRACLLLQIEGGFSQHEIATLLHLSEKSISIYVQRASEQFRVAYTRLTSDQASPIVRSDS